MRSEQEPGRGTAGEAGGEAGGSQCAVCEGGDQRRRQRRRGGRAGKSRGGNVVFLLPQDEMLMFHFQKGRSLLGNPIVPC